MFGAARDSVLTTWAAEGENEADYLEAFSFEDDLVAAPHNFRSGHLVGHQIREWLRKPVPTESPSGKRCTGGFRLLICERQQYSPLDFPITQAEFELAEAEFRLPASTLATFDSDAGSHSRYLSYEDPARTRLRRIGVVVKAPQKREIGNYGLSMSHDIKSGMTTALLHGTNVPCFAEWPPSTFNPADGGRRASKDSCHRRQPKVKPNQLIVSPVDEKDQGVDAPLVKLLRSSLNTWSHPLLLPSVILAEHVRRAKLYCDRGKVMHETWAIEGELGVTYVGRFIDTEKDDTIIDKALGRKWSSPFTIPRREERQTRGRQLAQKAQNRLRSGGIIGRAQAEELTVRINTQSLRILFTARSPQWNGDCSRHMKELLDELARGMPDRLDMEAHNGLKELLEYNMAMAEAVGSHVASMKERMALQLDVLYSMVAQMDNRLSARLAASAGRDSTSMKILAFITALYLPSSTVATVFSMSMFVFPHTGSDGSGGAGNVSIVSSWFWLFWAVALPLTIVTLGGWGIWWQWEMRTFRRDYAEALDEPDDPAVGSSRYIPAVVGTHNPTSSHQRQGPYIRGRVAEVKQELSNGHVNDATTSGAEAV